MVNKKANIEGDGWKKKESGIPLTDIYNLFRSHLYFLFNPVKFSLYRYICFGKSIYFNYIRS